VQLMQSREQTAAAVDATAVDAAAATETAFLPRVCVQLCCSYCCSVIQAVAAAAAVLTAVCTPAQLPASNTQADSVAAYSLNCRALSCYIRTSSSSLVPYSAPD
jgi:hypothetical protein